MVKNPNWQDDSIFHFVATFRLTVRDLCDNRTSSNNNKAACVFFKAYVIAV